MRQQLLMDALSYIEGYAKACANQATFKYAKENFEHIVEVATNAIDNKANDKAKSNATPR